MSLERNYNLQNIADASRYQTLFLCAKAAGIKILNVRDGDNPLDPPLVSIDAPGGGSRIVEYNPMENGDQVVALMEQFRFYIDRHRESWTVGNAHINRIYRYLTLKEAITKFIAGSIVEHYTLV